MRERLTTLACALGALLVFATLFIRAGDAERQRAAPPNTLERGGNGLLAAMSWLRSEGLRTVSLRERFDTLSSRADLPASGNLLILSTPAVTAFRPSEAAALERWLGAGNTLLVLAALSDRPGWALGGFVHSDLTMLTGLEFTLRTPATLASQARHPGATRAPAESAGERARRSDAGSNAMSFASLELRQPLHSTLVGNRPHPYLDGVGAAVALSDYSPQIWDIKLSRTGFVLSLAQQREQGEGVLWVRSLGAGTVIVSAFGSLFSNRALGLADNARLLGNIVSDSVAPGAAVLFDDAHQGLAAAYDPAKFYRDPRLYATLGVLFTVWLVWVIGGTRLRLPASRAPAPREAELVSATGTFLARVLRPAAAARRMFEHFFARLASRAHRAGQAGPPWEWLEQQPRLALADVAQLREWYADAHSDRRVPLMRLHNLIVRTERQLAA
jgi:hypothetical protein